MDDNINFEKLRLDLIDYFGTAMFNGFPAAIVDMSDVEKASKSELIDIANKNNFDLEHYKYKDNIHLNNNEEKY